MATVDDLHQKHVTMETRLVMMVALQFVKLSQGIHVLLQFRMFAQKYVATEFELLKKPAMTETH